MKTGKSEHHDERRRNLFPGEKKKNDSWREQNRICVVNVFRSGERGTEKKDVLIQRKNEKQRARS